MQQRSAPKTRKWYHFDSADSAAAQGAGGVAPEGIAGRGPRAGATATPAAASERDPGTHAPIGLPRALGTPPAGSAAYRRSPILQGFDLSALPKIERDSVALFDLLNEHVPPYLRSTALADAVLGNLKELLSPDLGEARKLTVEVKDLQSGQTTSHALTEAEITVGSHASALIKLTTAMASRRHARIVAGDGGYQLVDQGSSNGTFLRGERIQSGYAYALKSGETFTVPGAELTVRWAERPPAPQLTGLKVLGVRTEAAAAFLGSLPRQGAVAAIRIEPGGLRVALELDLALAHLLVARALGGSQPLAAGDAVPLRPLGEVDKGVLELVLVRLLDAVQTAFGPQAEATLHLERLHDGGDPALAALIGGGPLVVVPVGLEYDQKRDTMRLAIPRASLGALATRFARTVDPAGSSIEELYHRYRELIGLARAEVAFVAGAMKVSRADLRALEVGAICFPDQLALRIGAGGVEGEVDIVPAMGRGRAKVRGRLVQYAQPLRVEIEEVGIGPGGRPQTGEGGMAEQAEGGAEETGEGVALLDDVPMALVIELGRLSLTVRDLAKLRRGQVLELGRGPEDPVNLVVDGHLVGTGKLVNVEGEIGVQVLDLLR